jgi:catechol 2,3-dioxygenase
LVKVRQLGHVVLKVRERERSERFYAEVLGLQIAARRDTPPMTFFTLGNHHDFAIVALGTGAPDSPADSPGLYHVAFKAGDSIDDLRRAKTHFGALGVPVDAIEDHALALSIYLHDPDGNAIEMYVDTADVWRTDPQAVASISPLTL